MVAVIFNEYAVGGIMDVRFFLKERTKIVRQHYELASAPFLEIMRKIEEGETPFEPPYSEDGEPPFLTEWLDAKTCLELLGLSCVSILSESLKVYFHTWELELGIQCQPNLKGEFKNGFVNGYKACFGLVLNTDWTDCPVNFDILEQVVLARNSVHHHSHITTMQARHSEAVLEKYDLPFFISDSEMKAMSATDTTSLSWLTRPYVVVTRESLFEAIRQVDALADWLEEKLFLSKYS